MATIQDNILRTLYLKKRWMDVKEVMQETGYNLTQVHKALIHLKNRELIKKTVWIGSPGKRIYLKVHPSERRVTRALQKGFNRVGEEYAE